MSKLFVRFPGFRDKAVTLSYDDGVRQDKRLISIMQKYGLKGTFNINSGQFSDKYEDEVFNVANLPRPERRTQNDGRRPRKAGNASARK